MLVQVPTGYPFFTLGSLHLGCVCLPERQPTCRLCPAPSLSPTSTVQFAPFVLNIYTMKAEVRNSHHHFTAEAGTLEKGNNRTKNRILKNDEHCDEAWRGEPGDFCQFSPCPSLLLRRCRAEAARGSQEAV